MAHGAGPPTGPDDDGGTTGEDSGGFSGPPTGDEDTNTDDSSDFFDEDLDYSTDLPEEEQLPGSPDAGDDGGDTSDPIGGTSGDDDSSFQEDAGAAPGPDESPPGAGDEVDATAGTDPDAGDDSTRILRDDARSDPLTEQTKVAGGRTRPPAYVDQPGAQSRRLARYTPGTEAYRRRVSGRGQQGIETGGGRGQATVQLTNDAGQPFRYTGPASDVARRAEERFLRENPEYSAEDVRFVQDESGTIRLEFTSSGEQRSREIARQSVARDLSRQTGEQFTPGDVRLERVTGESFVDQPGAQGEPIPGFSPYPGFRGSLTEEAEADLAEQLRRDVEAFEQRRGGTGGLDLGGADPTDPADRGDALPPALTGPSIGEQFGAIFAAPTLGAGLGRAEDFARDLTGRGHAGDTISSERLARESGFDFALDLVLGDSERVARDVFGLEGRVAEDRIDVTGPALGDPEEPVDEGEPGELDRDVLESLAGSGGFYSEEAEEGEAERAVALREEYTTEEAARTFVTDLTGSEEAGEVAGGLGSLTGEGAAIVSTGRLLLETGVETGQNLPRTAEQYGIRNTIEAITEVTGRTAQAQIELVEERPYFFVGSLAGAFATGAIAGRLIETAPDVARSASIRARGGRVYDLEDLSDPPRETGGLPAFSEEARADPAVARREFLEQARTGALAEPSTRPTLSLGFDAEGGPLRVSPELRSAVAGQARRPLVAAEAAGFRAGRATGRGIAVAERVASDPRAAARTVAETPLDVAQTVGFGAGRRVGRGIARTEQFVDEFPGRAATTARRPLDAAEALGFRAGERTGAGLARLADADPLLPAEEAGFALGLRAGRGFRRLGDLRSRPRPDARELATRPLDAAEVAGVRAGERTGAVIARTESFVEELPRRARATGRRPFAAAEDLGFRAGERVGRGLDLVTGDRPPLSDLTLTLDIDQPPASPVAFHGRAAEDVAEYGGFGRAFEAPVGSSELPGLFQSADLSPLRLGGGAGGLLSRPSLRLPRPSLRSGRIAAERDVDVDVAEGRTLGEVGAFLAEEADPGRSYIRPGKTLTGEQEAIAPPGALFEGTGETFGVRVGGTRLPLLGRRGGRVIPGSVFERAGGDAGDADLGDLVAGTERASDELERALADDATPFVPLGGPGGGLTTRTSDRDTGLDEPLVADTLPTRRGGEATRTGPLSALSSDPLGLGELTESLAPSRDREGPTTPPTGGGPTSLTSPPSRPSRSYSPIAPSSYAASTAPRSPLLTFSMGPPEEETPTSPPPTDWWDRPSDRGRDDERKEELPPWVRRLERDLLNPITGE